MKKAYLIATIVLLLVTGQTLGAYNYGEAMQKAIYFYMQQRSGDLPASNPVIWRADSCLNDSVPGGYYDAGDHVKFNLPMASSAVTMAWGVYEYQSGFSGAGQLDEVRDAIKWVCDYLADCHTGGSTFVYQVGSGSADHAWWGPIEVIEEVMTRPSYSCTQCSTVQAASAAALAAATVVGAGNYLSTAVSLYNAAASAQSDSGYTAASGFYNSYSGFWDELAAAAMWLYIATGDSSYITKAESAAANWGEEGQEGVLSYKWTHSWDDMHYMAQILLARATGKQVYIDSVERNLDYWMPSGGITYTPGGLAFLDSWGSLRYAVNAAFLAFVWSDESLGNSSKKSTYRSFAQNQVNYALGSNPRSRSYVCGFGANPPRNPHHRTAHGSWANNINTPDYTRHILYGAMVGGPDSGDNYQDVRSDYTMNEVACDYNAGLVAVLAKMYSLYGGTPISGFPSPSDFTKDADPYDEFFASAKINSEGTVYTEWSVDLTNHSAWPARATNNLSYRYFVDLTEVFNAGYSLNDIIVSQNYAEVPVTISGPTLWSGNIYYVTVDYSGSVIFPGGQSESAKETQVRVRLPYEAPDSAWDPTNDWSYQGLTNTFAQTRYIPVYEAGVLLYGDEPGGGTTTTTTAASTTTTAATTTTTAATTSTTTTAATTTTTAATTTTTASTTTTAATTTTTAAAGLTAYYCDVDAMSSSLPMTVGGNLNSKTVATSSQYTAIASSDNSRWTTSDPGTSDEVFLWLENSITDGGITSIDLTFEGYLSNSSATFSIWARDVANSTWDQIGTTQSISTGSDGTMTRSITSEISNYVSGGTLIWGVYESTSSQSLNIDYVNVVVNMGGTTTTTAATTTTTAATTTTTSATTSTTTTAATTTTTAATTTTTAATTTTTAATTTTTAAAGCTCDSGCDGTAITPNFSQNGSGQYCWQATSGTYINSWNLAKLEVNNTDYTNLYTFTSSFPAKINGVWYIYYNSSVGWGHFELNN